MKALLYAAESLERYLKASCSLSWMSCKVFQAMEAAGDVCPIGEVARRMQTVPSHVTALVDTMEREGLIIRVRSKQDRRSVHLQATVLGMERYADARQFLDSLPPPDTVTEYLIAVTALTAPEAARQAV